ncbi:MULTISPECIES: hypothetical protein [unclassified Dyadobacter]|uniref:hypothetical protein n=1 Tax=unclassified Dyadobacter TaxID=2625061 RepID=UPI001F228D55|nr:MULTISPECIES: hypothetical protein [unclassified Dyadobacter]MCE7069409.1 hypothetical protein [Dyadobacter sp. CY327]MCF2516361.1 hypothetical protein [Dyadobacter sp. CY351]
MKLLHNAPAITKAIVLAAMMSACQNEKDAVVSPATSVEQEKDANAKTAITYLIKDGGTKLTYSGIRNQLVKELDGAGWLKEYTYSGNNITCALKTNGITVYKNFITYTLNAKGQCVESVHTATDKVIGGTYIYVYNELNQLTLVYHKSLPKLRQVFEYEQDADNSLQGKSLSKITFYDQYDKKEKEIIFKHANGKFVAQSNSSGNVYETSLEANPLNPVGLAEANSAYLPIFGKFSRYVLKQTVHKAFVGQIIYPYPVFNYNLSAKSLGGEITTYDFITKDDFGKILSKVERKYSTTPQAVMIGQ